MAPNYHDADRLNMSVICGQIGERCMHETLGRPVTGSASEEVCPLGGVELD